MFQNFLAYFKIAEKLITLYKKNKTAFILAICLFFSITHYNRRSIEDYLGITYFKTDITKDYIEQTIEVEGKLDDIRNDIGSDEVAIFLFHNGEVTVSRMHMLKFTLMFQSTEKPNNNKYIIYRQHLSPYVKYLHIMILDSFLYVPCVKDHEDILMRNFNKYFGLETILYVPLFKDGQIIGFVAAAWKTQQNHLSQHEIDDFVRLVSVLHNYL
jgi:hypothetical protein